MGRYRIVFSLAVEHTFFSEGSRLELDCVPTARCSRLLTQAGLLARKTANGVLVSYDEQRVDALELCATEPTEPLSLGFKMYAKDPLFSNYTDPAPYREGSMLLFDTRRARLEPAGRLRLHEGDVVGEREFEPLTSPALEGLLGKRDRLIRPLCLVNIHPFAQDRGSLVEQLQAPPKDYAITFKARQTFWKYYLLGTMTQPAAYIADLNNETEFECLGSTSLPGRRTAVAFRSKRPIPLQEHSDCRFQLREKGAGNGRILVRRLPVASAEHVARERLDGETVLVSEIYIHC